MPSDLAKVVALMRRGGVALYPTETAYAVGCDATNARAVEKIFRIKGRSGAKSLPMIVASRAMAERYARFGKIERALAQKWWPGALTLVVNRKSQISNLKNTSQKSKVLASSVVARDGTIAMRVSSHPVARALSRQLGRPIVATSANRSGDPVAYTLNDALRSLGIYGGQSSVRRTVLPDAAVDVGRLPKRKTSTVVKVSDGKIEVLRSGAILLSSRHRSARGRSG